MIHNVLSSNEIADILNNHIVVTNKGKLSLKEKVDFFVEVPLEIKVKLEAGFGINLQETIPMRWIKGDTPQHIDKGANDFNNTYLMYLTDSIGSLIIDEQSYPINAGDAHIFNEGISHYTINTGDSERLMIGPMSETGFHVGMAYSAFYFNNETDANQSAASVDEFGNPDTTTAIDSGFYTIQTVGVISSWFIATNTGGIEPSPNGGPYNTDTELIPSGIYYLYPYTPPAPPTPLQSRSLYIRRLFTNNSQVYYKKGSLSTGSGGSGVTNSRIKKRRT